MPVVFLAKTYLSIYTDCLEFFLDLQYNEIYWGMFSQKNNCFGHEKIYEECILRSTHFFPSVWVI